MLNVGRSWRIGPEPEYLCAWYTPTASVDRLDEWERVFRSGDADAYEEPFRLAARIDAAGCYEPLLEPVVGSKGKYYAEWFDLADGAGHDEVRSWYEERRAAPCRPRPQPADRPHRAARPGPAWAGGVGHRVVGRGRDRRP